MTEIEPGRAAPSQASPAERIRVRYFLIAWLVVIVWLPGAEPVLIAMGYDTPWYWLDIGLIYYGQTLLVTALALTLVVWRFPVSAMLGPRPDGPAIRSGLLWATFLFIVAPPALYVVYFPLSFAAPSFVQFWLIDLPDGIYFDNGVFPFLPNLLNVISLCVVAPIVEEVAFRGVVLHRWSHKFGIRKAILLSSFLFGIVHPDILGAFLFGIGMCILYLRFQSLWVPIISHGIYNLVAWLVELGFYVKDGPYAQYTLYDFQQDWPIAAAFGAVALLWALIYLRRRKPLGPLELPRLTP